MTTTYHDNEKLERDESDSETKAAQPGLENAELGHGSVKMEKEDASSTEDHSEESTLVTWNGEDDPENPKNWKSFRKWRAILGISSFVFMSPLSSTIVAPALPQISQDLDITQPAVTQMVLSIFLLGFACGPLCASPLSEVYGRIRVVQTWNFMYLVFNTCCGFAQTKEALIVLRFVSGLCGSATLGIGGGTLSDLFRAKDRGKAVAIYSWSPILAPVVGAIVGAFLAEHTTWRWAFYTGSLLDAAIQILGLIFLEETYPPLILRRRKQKLMKQTSNRKYHTEFDYLDESTGKVLATNLIRPFKLLGTQPIVQVLALYNAFLYGIIYILYADFINVWTDIYDEPIEIAGLNYISLAIGSALAAECCTLVNDRIYRRLSLKTHGKGRPEYRIPIMVPGTIVLCVGLFLFGWGAGQRMHWIVPNIGCAMFVCGALACTISVNAYVVDTYGRYSASALAAVSTIRCLFGFTFPLFAPYLFHDLGYGWAGSLLAFVAIGIGLPAVFMLGKFGAALRERSPYAAEEASG